MEFNKPSPSPSPPSSKVSHPLRPFEKITIRDQCPHCGSVFVTKRECESCGYQFWIDLVGKPFGERSFFEIESNYYENLHFWERFLPQKYFRRRKKHQRYLRFLKRRWAVLLGYFFDVVDENRERRKLFLFEAKALIGVFVREGGEVDLLWEGLEGREKHPLAIPLSLEVKTATSLKNREMGLFTGYWKSQFGEGLQASFLIKMLLGGGLLITLALSLYPYIL